MFVRKAMKGMVAQPFCTATKELKDVTFLEQVIAYFDKAATYTDIKPDKLKSAFYSSL